MIFYYVTGTSEVPSTALNAVYLTYDNWDDYGFGTTFGLTVFDEHGEKHELPRIKIGFIGQTESVKTHSLFKEPFSELSEGFFSLCDSVDFYKTLQRDFSAEWRDRFLSGINDLVAHPELLESVKNENVVRTSLLRGVRIDVVKDQFSSVLRGEILLTDFNFSFELPPSEKFAGFDLQFEVKANSTPSTNMHALIGRNGVGKTTYLSEMIKAVSPHTQTDGKFYDNQPFWGKAEMDVNSYFGSLISVAFSAFDPFNPPPPPNVEGPGLRYSYIGLTDYSNATQKHLKTDEMLHEEFADALGSCFAERDRKVRWEQAVNTLQSDQNFAAMQLLDLANFSGDELRKNALSLVQRMSSGHTIVILSITLLVARVDEKTLVLFDEPESHLQPPLLSAFMRSIAQLLRARNAVAIVATHSPVVLQEIPKSCVWKVFRSRLSSEVTRPDTETFGENVGILTTEVFGLDVSKSGFHTVLSDLVKAGHSYEKILEMLNGSLGFEGRGILKAMVANRGERTLPQ